MVTVAVKRPVEHTPTAFNGSVYTEAVQWQCTLIHANTRQMNFCKNTLNDEVGLYYLLNVMIRNLIFSWKIRQFLTTLYL